jgi:hypothetical protein
MDLGNNLGHLTYSTLVHPADTWEEMKASLMQYVPAVKARVAPNEPCGISLRLSAASARTLAADAAERAELKRFLSDNDMYLYTVNAFPYGPFKNTVVKEQVYEPDWHSEERVQYTIDVANVLADVVPEGVVPSIQTTPLAFKPRVTGPDYVATFTRNILRVVAHLVQLEARTGRRITLAIEPEPFCFLATTDDTVEYFGKYLYCGAGATELAKLAGVAISDAHAALRQHVGVVFDICHHAIAFEDITESLGKLVNAGIPIFKLQEAAAVRIPEVTQEIIDGLARYADTIYLTQTNELMDGKINQYLNLEDAFAAWKKQPGGQREWRIHFHVPVFLDDLGLVRTTRSSIEEALRVHKATPLSSQLEIETYTWDVLPEHLKTGDIVEYVTREIEWVREQLTS